MIIFVPVVGYDVFFVGVLSYFEVGCVGIVLDGADMVCVDLICSCWS